MKYIFSLIAFVITGCVAFAQELNCQVNVMAPQIQNVDKKVFETLQQSIFEFMNNTKWTSDKFLNQERIECSVMITINERVSNDEYKGSIQVTARRPVYQASYNSPTLNFNDDNFQFKYIEYQPLEFSENGSNPNLTAVLAFYANIILGIDYDSFSLYGGAPYFAKAQTIVNNMQNAREAGWRAFESTRNRYWLSENMTNPIFKPFHEMFYRYHLKGLDIMAKKKDDGLSQITESLELLSAVHREKPGSLLLQTLFYAKADEIVNIYSGAFPDQKVRITNLLNEIDPANGTKYAKIMAN
jgi:hypothetical protein